MTDTAMMRFVVKQLDDTQIDNSLKNKKEKSTLPFDSKYKMMAKVINENNTYRIYVKGAPERFFGHECNRISKYVTKVGLKDFDDESKKRFETKQMEFADGTFRTILLGYKDITDEVAKTITGPEFETYWDKHIYNINLIAMFGIRDPPKSGVGDVIARLRNDSKITVRMVTGDNIMTAIAISKTIGIITFDEANQAKEAVLKIEKLKSDSIEQEKLLRKTKQKGVWSRTII